LKFSKEKGVRNIRDNEYIRFGNLKVWPFIEGVYIFHEVLVYDSISFFLMIADSNEIITDAMHSHTNIENESDGIKELEN